MFKFGCNAMCYILLQRQGISGIALMMPILYLTPRLTHLRRSVDSLQLSQHALKCLKSANIRTVRELAAANEVHLLKVKGCGAKTIEEIRETLAQMRLTMNTVFDERGQIELPALDLIEKTRKLKRLTDKR